jgi:hypothetical protein
MRFMFFGVAFGQMDFLQIPPHDGHPCPWLALPLIGCAEDSHLLDLRPTGRTTKNPEEELPGVGLRVVSVGYDSTKQI